MSNDVPQFPGKGGAPRPGGQPQPTQAQPSWKNVVCPILTAGEIARHKDQLVVTAGVQASAVKAQACLGPQCMMFIQVPMADGTVRSGCAPVQLFGQMVGLNMQVSEFIAAAKAGALAEMEAEKAASAPTPEPLSPLTEAADAATKES